MDIIKNIEENQRRANAQPFNVGDTVKVFFKIVEGKNERVQVYEGIVICKHGGGSKETFTVRKDSYGVGVERIFPVHSPRISKVEVVRPGKVRRAKLYYLRDAVGKAAKVKAKVGGNIAKQVAERNARENAVLQEAMAKEAAAKQAAQAEAK